MVVIQNANNVMYQCKVFYIGAGSPDTSRKGVEAVQQPLRDRYRGSVSNVEGYDVTITVMPDVVHVKYSSEMEEDLVLPISTLSICAAVRCVEGSGESGNTKFVPVHSVITANEPDSEHPAIFATVMRRNGSDSLMCHAFICNSTRDALHLVNATQTAHTALRRGYSPTGAMKFFIDQSTEFDRTLRVTNTASTNRKSDATKIYMYQEDYDTRQYNADTRTYVSRVEDADYSRTARISTRQTNGHVTADESHTYYVKAGDYQQRPPPENIPGETIVVRAGAEIERAPTPEVREQTIIIDKPVIRPQPPPEPPKVKVVERPVMIDPPAPPKMKEQLIYVDKPVFREAKWPNPPAPKIVEREVFIDPPPPPRMEPQQIVVDKPILREYPRPPTPPAPMIKENPVYIDPPEWPRQKPQTIIVDKPIVRPIPDPPPAPAPIIQTREVFIDPPEFPPQQAHKIVVEKPVFNPPRPAPRPPTPIIEEKKVYIDPPPYPEQERQRIIVEKPIIRDPGPPPPHKKPIIVEKPVYIDAPKYQEQEPQTIIVEKPVFRDPGPPPPPPKPIIVYKTVYIDPPPWPKQEPQRIIVEKPVIRQRAPPPPMKPVIIEKPVMVDVPEAPPAPAQRIVVEKPVLRTTYGMSETRREPSAYNYHYQYQRPANVRSSYVVRREAAPARGLRRYAWSEVGEDRDYRMYGQPRDFRYRENQFMNERSFGHRINQELKTTSRAPNSYAYGDAYRLTERRGSVH